MLRPTIFAGLLALAPASAFAQPNFNRPPSVDTAARPAARPEDVS